MRQDLIRKYNVPGPRYTSYPTVPYWDESFFGIEAWKESLKNSFDESNDRDGISLYIHLPFCESMCTFCGCSKRITKNHKVEETYIKALLKEWRLYCSILERRPLIRELHLGGGTPTFFHQKISKTSSTVFFSGASKTVACSMSFEGHPNNTTRGHLQTLFDLGFRRVSFGIQDYDHKVQLAINRIQTLSQVATVVAWAKSIGYESVGNDIVYGLPFQTKSGMLSTLAKTIALEPHSIAFYSYAHVPWLKGNGQRGFQYSDIPTGEQKQELYESGKELLIEAGYEEIGMDHFALKSDPLYRASQSGTLHRNFMGYTPFSSKVLIGLGVSAISDSWYGFAQNVKNLEDYYQMLEWDAMPVVKGHSLTEEDIVIRKHILNLMCGFETSWLSPEMRFNDLENVLISLEEMVKDGLVEMNPGGISITRTGRPFLRMYAWPSILN